MLRRSGIFAVLCLLLALAAVLSLAWGQMDIPFRHVLASLAQGMDLPGGDYHEILHSVNVALAQVADETKVYPGHGPASRMGRERRCNPYLQQG